MQRRADVEPCADAAAQSDAQARTVHGAFGRCRENAQNECPAWSGALDTVIDQCLDMMFAEGPGSGFRTWALRQHDEPQLRPSRLRRFDRAQRRGLDRENFYR